MHTLWQWMRKHFYPLFLTFIVGLIVGANYTPGTFLSGWDTLHPEFNLPLAFSRVVTGVWRADQGLGAVAAHSHMADLPHLAVIWALSIIEPVQLVRYTFTFSCLLAGVLGTYFFIKHILKTQKLRSFVACIGALTYLTNLGTVQQFIVPFEMFTVQYAILPWILLTATQYIEAPSRKTMIWAIVAILLASPMAYAATLWYAFFALFAIYVLLISWNKHWTNGLKLLVITLILNLYWILPNLYFVAFHGKDVELSKVNRLFSPEAFAKNQEFGNITNLPLIKNFLFDWQLYTNKSSGFSNVMAVWQSHLDNPLVQTIGIMVFLVALTGIIQVFRSRNKAGRAIVVLFVLSGLALLNGTWPITVAFNALGNISGIAKEALRLPFTKFSIVYGLSMSVLVGFGCEFIISKMNRKAAVAGLTASIVALIFYFSPAFTGNFIHPAMRITIPSEYFDMFAWFNGQNHDGRVAIFPIHSFWNWTYYTWGYQGAGFLQFGIPQPILDRDYDRWNPDNEQYEREMSYAVYSQNPDNIRAVLTKYNVSWVMVDTSIFTPASNENQMLLWLLPELLARAGTVPTATFGDHITVYAVDGAQPTVTGYTDLPLSDPLNAYFPLVNPYERVMQPIPGMVIAQYTGATYRSTDVPDTDHGDLSLLDHSKNYLLEITSRHVSGFPLQLCVSNSLTSHCDLYVHLGTQKEFMTERFLLPNLQDYGFGYSADFNNFTIAGVTSENEITTMRVREIPPDPVGYAPHPGTVISEKVNQILPILYRVRISAPTTTLVFQQSFEPGWIAVQNGKVLTKHVPFNDWANAWAGNFGTSGIIYIIFWPQLLEWFGFILLPVGVMIAVKRV